MSESKICGIIPPIVTPLDSKLEFDFSALDKIINFVIEGGVNGIFMLGTNGECSSLTTEIKTDVISQSVKLAAGKVPVYVNVTTASYLETLQLTEIAERKGADYVVLAPPYYFEMNQQELYNYIELIANKSSLPVILYNAPQYTKTSIEPDTVAKLSSHQNIVGLKDSSGSMFYLHSLINKCSDKKFSILVGHEIYLGGSILLGLNGGVNGGGNVFPKLYVAMYNAAINENLHEMRKLQRMIQKVQNTVYETIDSPIAGIIGLKHILSLRGLCNPQMAMPIHSKLNNNQIEGLEKLVMEFEKLGF